MLHVYRNKDSIKLDLNYDIDFYHTFENKRTSECEAELCVQSFNRKIKSTLKKIREEAYNQGWKDKSDKKGSKETWFSGSF
jgi:hypothetical protein